MSLRYNKNVLIFFDNLLTQYNDRIGHRSKLHNSIDSTSCLRCDTTFAHPIIYSYFIANKEFVKSDKYNKLERFFLESNIVYISRFNVNFKVDKFNDNAF